MTDYDLIARVIDLENKVNQLLARENLTNTMVVICAIICSVCLTGCFILLMVYGNKTNK